jgi:hypothetical protein
MNRRTALALVAALPGIASASPKPNTKANRVRTMKVLPNTPESDEGQFLALFLALLVSRTDNTGAIKYGVDTFRNSNGVVDPNDRYFSYTPAGAYAKAYDLLVKQGKYASLLQFQHDYRGFSVEMLNYLDSAAAAAGPYPKVCPLDTNLINLLNQVG